VASDFGFIPDSSQRNTNELPPQGSGYRPAKRGLPYPRRTDETKNRAFDLFGKLTDTQILYDSLFYFIQTVVILIQDYLCLFKV
jgi:hypothetical protein